VPNQQTDLSTPQHATPQYSTPPRQNGWPKEQNQLLAQALNNVMRTPRVKQIDVLVESKPPAAAAAEAAVAPLVGQTPAHTGTNTPKGTRTPKPRKLRENWVSECLSNDPDEEALIARYETGFLNLMVNEPLSAEDNGGFP
jgi:hypothetical protein